jgi:hypothetical protein
MITTLALGVKFGPNYGGTVIVWHTRWNSYQNYDSLKRGRFWVVGAILTLPNCCREKPAYHISTPFVLRPLSIIDIEF